MWYFEWGSKAKAGRAAHWQVRHWRRSGSSDPAGIPRDYILLPTCPGIADCDRWTEQLCTQHSVFTTEWIFSSVFFFYVLQYSEPQHLPTTSLTLTDTHQNHCSLQHKHLVSSNISSKKISNKHLHSSAVKFKLGHQNLLAWSGVAVGFIGIKQVSHLTPLVNQVCLIS